MLIRWVLSSFVFASDFGFQNLTTNFFISLKITAVLPPIFYEEGAERKGDGSQVEEEKRGRGR